MKGEKTVLVQKMKKNIFIIMITLIVLSLLAGCKDDGDGSGYEGDYDSTKSNITSYDNTAMASNPNNRGKSTWNMVGAAWSVSLLSLAALSAFAMGLRTAVITISVARRIPLRTKV